MCVSLRRLALLASLAVPTCADDVRLYESMRRFSENYNRFVAKWDAGVFDAGQARRLSALWREVERSGYWPNAKEKR